MLNRQRVVLAMLREHGGAATRLELTKWLFLLANESPSRGGVAFYQFVPYKHGPFSFSLYQEAAALVRDGYLAAPDDATWALTALGTSCPVSLPAEVLRQCREIVRLYAPLGPSQLLDVVYRHHPWFTVKAERVARRAVSPPEVTTAVYTMGYEGLLIDGFMDRLLRSGIRRIIDVRNNPTSRRYGFHGSTLARIAGYLGVGYEHFPSVGIPPLARSGLADAASYDRLFALYEANILPGEGGAIARIAGLVAEQPSALVCMEADPVACHRSRLARAVAPLAHLPIVHLGWPR